MCKLKEHQAFLLKRHTMDGRIKIYFFLKFSLPLYHSCFEEKKKIATNSKYKNEKVKLSCFWLLVASWKSSGGLKLYTATLWKSRTPELFKKGFTNPAGNSVMFVSYLFC